MRFKNKRDLYKYIKTMFKESDLIFIQGSTAYGRIKNFSDFDVEIYGKKLKKPYYELAFIKNIPVLISAYFHRFTHGEKVKAPEGVRIIKGYFTDKLKREHTPMYGEGSYNAEEKLRRECQLVTDFCFKYFRSKDKQYLRYIQKRIK